jgi:hypothetical protein
MKILAEREGFIPAPDVLVLKPHSDTFKYPYLRKYLATNFLRGDID